MNDSSLLPNAYLVATAGSEYIGLRELAQYDRDSVLGGLMGVRRDYTPGPWEDVAYSQRKFFD